MIEDTVDWGAEEVAADDYFNALWRVKEAAEHYVAVGVGNTSTHAAYLRRRAAFDGLVAALAALEGADGTDETGPD